MLVNYHLYFLFILVGIGASIVPGPSILYMISQGATLGFMRSIPSLFGLFSGSIIYALLTIVGVGLILTKFPQVLFAVHIIGAVYLIYFGYKRLTSVAKQQELKISKGMQATNFTTGMMITLSNPKILLFYFFVIPQFIDPHLALHHQVDALVWTQLVIKLLILFLYAIVASSFGAQFIAKGYENAVHKVTGLILLVAGVIMLCVW